MFTFLKRILGIDKQEISDPDAIVEELWQTDFRKASTARFLEENGDSFTAAINDDGLSLSFTRQNVYAWTLDPIYRYRDFVAEAIIEFPRESAEGHSSLAGTMAAGIAFRYLNDSTFYSVLVSDGGMVRMDAVVNGTPVPVLGWTETRTDETEEGDEAPYRLKPETKTLRIVAQATSFTIIVNDCWVAECADDTIQAAGNVAFAGQNWGARDRNKATLRAISIESRPIEVETVYTRWNEYIAIPPEARVNLAKTLHAMGRYVPAIIELKRAWKDREPGVDELILSARIHLTQRLVPEAEESVRKALALEPANPEALAELAGILYLDSRFADLRELFASIPEPMVEASPFFSNVRGHLNRWLGDHDAAAADYHRAASLAPDQGLFYLHEGNELLASGNDNAAIAAWLEAARIFLSTEDYDDLSDLVTTLGEKAPDNPLVAAIAGKYKYATDDGDGALASLEKAIALGSEDSAVWYLYGMLLSGKEDTDGAISALRKAVALAPDYGQYRFRLAETLYLAGRECDAEIDDALKANASGWTHNLAAMRALAKNDVRAAESHILEARRLLPSELPVIVNLAEIYRRQGRLDEALPLLDTDEAEALRAGANLLVQDERHEEAEGWYVRALRKSPFDAELLTDRAANCLKLDLINEADDLLGRAIGIAPSTRIYRLIAFLAGRKGEFARAEIALQQGIEEFGQDEDLLFDLAEVYRTVNKREKAAMILDRLRPTADPAKLAEYDRQLEESGTNGISCSVCGREWRVPKDIPPQGSLHLTAEPPDEVPAGTCPACQVHYCIGCAKKNLGDDGRFRCARCGQPLKLIDQNVIWLLNKWQDGQNAP